MSMLLKLFLAIHLVGLVLTAGMTITRFILFFNLWRSQDSNGLIELHLARRTNIFLGVGMGIAILSGLIMMHLAYSAFAHQLWFQLKVGAIFLALLCGIFIMRSQRSVYKLSLIASKNLPAIKFKLLVGSGIQVFCFLLVIIFASFRFG